MNGVRDGRDLILLLPEHGGMEYSSPEPFRLSRVAASGDGDLGQLLVPCGWCVGLTTECIPTDPGRGTLEHRGGYAPVRVNVPHSRFALNETGL